MFIFFACLYTLFLRVQRKRTSSEAAKEKAASHLAHLRWTTLCSAENIGSARGLFEYLKGINSASFAAPGLFE